MPGRVVVVTGASGGIGRATAVAFAARGDRVALLARGESGLHAAAARSSGPGATRSSCRRHGRRRRGRGRRGPVEPSSGPIDVWVNNAFASVFAPFDEISRRSSAA